MMYEEKFRRVKYDDVVDKYGYVINLELAKHLISLLYHDNRNPNVKDWVEKCQESLIQREDSEFTLRDPETGRTYLGGPGGYSGYMFQEFGKYCEDEFPEGNFDQWEIYGEEHINECLKVFVIIEYKPRLFIVREAD